MMLATSFDVDCPARPQALQEEEEEEPSPTRTNSAWSSPVRVSSPLAEAKRAGNDEEEEWAANPWQAQVDAHIMQLRQAGAVFPQVPAASSTGNNGFHGSGVAFGVPSAVCGVPLQASPPLVAGGPVTSVYHPPLIALAENPQPLSSDV